jgi:hypothetical protein
MFFQKVLLLPFKSLHTHHTVMLLFSAVCYFVLLLALCSFQTKSMKSADLSLLIKCLDFVVGL